MTRRILIGGELRDYQYIEPSRFGGGQGYHAGKRENRLERAKAARQKEEAEWREWFEGFWRKYEGIIGIGQPVGAGGGAIYIAQPYSEKAGIKEREAEISRAAWMARGRRHG